MAESAETTYEEATRCPKCTIPGDVRTKTPSASREVRPGTTVHLVYCMNNKCKWYNTCWAVQVNPDGTVPPPKDHRGERKIYENFMPDEQQRRVVESIERQLAAEQTSGHEINPYGR